VLTEKELQVLILRERGLLQKEIAKRLNMTQSAVSRFEANAERKIRDAKQQLEMLKKLGIDITDEDVEQRLRKLQGAKR